jgi:site-specific recombinase XerD
MECVRLRVKDVAFTYRQFLVRDGKGQKVRVTTLPQSLAEPLKRHMVKSRSCMNRIWQKASARCIYRLCLNGNTPMPAMTGMAVRHSRLQALD